MDSGKRFSVQWQRILITFPFFADYYFLQIYCSSYNSNFLLCFR